MNCEIIIPPSSTHTFVSVFRMSFQQDFCVNSTDSREICLGIGREREREGKKERKKKGVKYTKKRTFHGNQSVSRQSSVKKRRAESRPLRYVLLTVTLTVALVSTTPPQVSDSNDTPTSSERKL